MSSFSKKHYVTFAQQFKELRQALEADGHWTAGGVSTLAKDSWFTTRQKFITMFEADNPRFDTATFIAATEPEPTKKEAKRAVQKTA